MRFVFDLHLVEWLYRKCARVKSGVWHSIKSLGTAKLFSRGRAKCSALTSAAGRNSEASVAD